MRAGFTYIQLCAVVIVIAILSIVAYIALDPMAQFRDHRDARRLSDIFEIIDAIKADQIANNGNYLAAIQNMIAGQIYMIGNGIAGCDDLNASCDMAVSSDTNCVNLAGLVTAGKLSSIPRSPNGAAKWTVAQTGYTLQRDNTGFITVRACESEHTTEIFMSR